LILFPSSLPDLFCAIQLIASTVIAPAAPHSALRPSTSHLWAVRHIRSGLHAVLTTPYRRPYTPPSFQPPSHPTTRRPPPFLQRTPSQPAVPSTSTV
jgi:hypothetical protein